MTSISRQTTTVTWLGLLALTGISFALSYAPLGVFGMPVALGIAFAKASLVALVFMELLTAPFTIKVTFVTAALFVALLAFFMVADVVTRAPPVLLPSTSWQ